jgi:predicted RNase H-like HicB family nuclease
MEKIIVLGYEVWLSFDKDDQIYIADASTSLPGCIAHGSTQELAAREIAVAIDLHIKAARELKRTVPAPLRMYGVAQAVN